MNAKTDNGEGSKQETPRRNLGDEQFEALIARALAVDVPAPAAARPPSTRPALARWAGLAAGVALVVGVALFQLRPPGPTGDITRDVIAHIHHEPGALVRTAQAVSPAAFEKVMQSAGVVLTPPLGTVSYVKLCPFRGEMVAHFVVQGQSGPVTVLLLPDEEVRTPMPVDEDGFRGTIAPLEIGGSIVVVGEPSEDLRDIQDRIADAVRWRI